MPKRRSFLAWLAPLLLLAACGSRDAGDEAAGGGNVAPIDATALLANLADAQPEDPARLLARAERAMSFVLQDPKNAEYSNIRSGAEGAVCGEVALKQGKMRRTLPFVVSPEGVATLSLTPDISFGDPADRFPDLYIRWCATPEELAGLRGELRTPRPPVDAALPPLDLPPADPAANAAAGPGAAPPAAPPRPRPSGEPGNFSDAVVRPAQPPSK